LIFELISTFFYCGKSKFAPGTVGTLVAFLISVPLLYFENFTLISTIIAILTLVTGIYTSDKYSKKIKKEDPKEVVIDEVSGYFTSLALSSLFIQIDGFNLANIIYLLLNFVAFRLFDIFKPYPISHIDKNIKGGFGIMLDDILAGIFAALFIIIVYYCR